MNESIVGQTSWIPGIVVLSLAALISAMWAYILFRRRQQAKNATNVNISDAWVAQTRKVEMLVEHLKELHADKHQLTEEKFLAEKARLEKLAADALRGVTSPNPSASLGMNDDLLSRQKSRDPNGNEGTAKTGFGARNPQLVGAFWGATVVGFFVLLGLLLTQESKPRTEQQGLTGKMPPRNSAMTPNENAQPPEDESLKAALQKVRENPDDVGALEEASHELIRVQQFDEAEKWTRRGLGLDPFNPELRVHEAVLVATRGDLMGAQKELHRLANVYPSAHEALLFMGGIAMQTRNWNEALESFERYRTEAPQEDQPPQVQQAIAMIRQQMAGGQP